MTNYIALQTVHAVERTANNYSLRHGWIKEDCYRESLESYGFLLSFPEVAEYLSHSDQGKKCMLKTLPCC